ncbi:MAG: DUF2970 domain-containing protein [Gammaproteobacteria bacterium]|nr:DUF2970 domain-containing protein [Gammaproteobacteria bacterium]
MTQPPEHQQDEEEQRDAPEPLSPWEIVTSTLAAALGVQSRRNRERDFSRGRPLHFIIAGVIFTVLFVVGMVLVVNLILSSAA